MKSSEILELVRAGYTKAEITAMDADQTPEVPQEENIEEAEPVTDTTEEITQSAANQPAQPAADDGVKDQMAMLIKAVEQMSNRIISNNINSTVTEGEPERGVSDILAAVINPPRKEGK